MNLTDLREILGQAARGLDAAERAAGVAGLLEHRAPHIIQATQNVLREARALGELACRPATPGASPELLEMAEAHQARKLRDVSIVLFQALRP